MKLKTKAYSLVFVGGFKRTLKGLDMAHCLNDLHPGTNTVIIGNCILSGAVSARIGNFSVASDYYRIGDFT